MKNHERIFIIIILVLLVFPSYARKSSSNFTDSQEYENLKTAVTNHGTSIANFQNQVSDLIAKVQTLNGDINRNYKKNKDQNKALSDSQIRLQTIEDKITSLTSQLLELQSEGFLSPQTTRRLNEYKIFARGLEYINSGQYGKAIKAMKTFKTQNSKSIFKSYAQFWIGESYYMQSDYKMAIKEYQYLLKTNSRSAKAPTALYRQGLSFFHLKAYDDANTFFAQVIRKYPKSLEAVQSSSQIKRIKDIQELQRQQNLETNLIQ